jgi:citrate lyase beta subunit
LTVTQTLLPSVVEAVLLGLAPGNRAFIERFPGEPASRQPLHTVYGGAQLWKADTAVRLGELALKSLDTYGATPDELGNALSIDPSLRDVVHRRVREKLVREPVEDFRIDFEDGFGVRPDPEEDEAAIRAGRELAIGAREGLLPPFTGIRIKPLGGELARRSLRTLDLFVTSLVDSGGIPDGFVVTLPKCSRPDEVTALVSTLASLENALALSEGTIPIEIMVELPQAIIGPDGRCPLPDLVDAARGRCRAAHFGTYDYTAASGITAEHQRMDHPVCDFAKHTMQVALAGRPLFLSDGATNVMPVGPHRGALTDAQAAENRAVVHRAWRLMYGHVRHSLVGGFYQGWDLHPAQLPVRYAAAFAFFLEGLPAATERLRNFVEKAAQATLVGDVFDDAATGQGLLNYFLRALSAGAIALADVEKTGLTADEVRGKSFVRILEARRRL